MSNTTRYFMSLDNVKTFAQGALGAMTFGMYHQYVTNNMMIMNNKFHDQEIAKIREQNAEIREQNAKMREQIDEMREQNAKRFFYFF